MTNKTMELADAYAVTASMTLAEPCLKRAKEDQEARAALQAEVEKLEQEHIQRLLRIEQKVDVLIAERDALRTLITKLHSAKGRYHTQLACCDLFDLVGLKNERPVK